ncbi:MAG: NERD domain-containing protein [Elusimicrobiales bacterium]|nr:NERD domain-containing protein [Elusimicrobiales bacterium]
MAFLIPRTIPESATKGEKRLFEILKENLSDDCVVYYNTEIKNYYPDFIIIHPLKGVIIIEVKDWSFDRIIEADKDSIILNVDNRDIRFLNPLKQVRNYILQLVDMLKRDELLLKDKKLSVNWGFGVFMSNFKKEDMEKLFYYELKKAFSDKFFIADDFSSTEKLELSLDKMFLPARPSKLEDFQVDEIRSIIYPELKINNDSLAVIDKHQERIARQFSNGHRLIRGVSGSGKTVMLVARAKFLSKINPDWKILVLCFNRSLSIYLKDNLKDFTNVEVMTYHSWCFKVLNRLGIEIPSTQKMNDDYWNNIIPDLMIESAKKSDIKYQSILIDEGQDFMGKWYVSVVNFLDKETNNLFIVYDNSQNIYKRSINWRKLSIDIVGRTEVFNTNYRNTKQIISVAYDLIEDLDKNHILCFEEDAVETRYENVIRSGSWPELKIFYSEDESKDYIYSLIKNKKKSVSLMFLFPNHRLMDGIYDYLNSKNIKTAIIGEETNTSADVKLATIHSSKGLESDMVIIYGANLLQNYFEKAEALRLLYIACTRARKELYIISLENNSITSLIDSNIKKAKDSKI